MARIFEFGTAPQAAAEGYKLVREVEGTEEQLMASQRDEDVVFVQSAAIFGKPGVFRFGRFERTAAPCHDKSKARTLKTEAAQIVALNGALNLAPITSDDAMHVAKVARQYARAKAARSVNQ